MASPDEIRESELRETPIKKADPSGWPKGVRPIAISEMDALGVDREGFLYWHGKRIEIRKTIELRKWEFAFALVVTIGTAMQAVAAFFPFLPPLIAGHLGF